MTIRIGEDISREQSIFLERARGRISVGELEYILQRVATNRDVGSGMEDLHTEWYEIYQRSREQLRRRLSAQELAYLEQFFRSAQMYGDLASLVSVDPSSAKIAFLLGAGASKPEPSNIPTVKELLPELLSRARRLDREQVTQLADFCDAHGIDNIEDLLTAVQIFAFCSRNPGVLSLVEFQMFRAVTGASANMSRHLLARPERSMMRADVASVAFLQDTLQVLFGLLSSLMLPAKPNAGHDAIAKYVHNNPKTAIITTNYDCCMDLALLQSGVQFSYEIDFANRDKFHGDVANDTHFIKLHGSLNWFYCETCQLVWQIDTERSIKDYLAGFAEYPIISVCHKCGGQRRGLLVPPHAMKFDVAPPLQPLIANAAKCFEDASTIVVVGFSFADADLYISRMISKAMQLSGNAKLVIIDPSRDVVEGVRQKFAAQIPDFDSKSRIVGLYDDCAKVLPQFLTGELFVAPQNAENDAAD